jgi:DNA-binding MarR family transcriptional regulator
MADHEEPTPPAAPEWERDVHHLLWETYTRMAVLAEQQFGAGMMTMATTGTLDQIDTWPGTTVAEMSRRTPKTQQAISQVVARLEKAGYVERRVGRGRGVGLYLTPAGSAALTSGRVLELRLEQRLRELFGDALYEQVRDVLQQARARLAA